MYALADHEWSERSVLEEDPGIMRFGPIVIPGWVIRGLRPT